LFFAFVVVLLIFLGGCSISAIMNPPTPTVDLPAALTALSQNVTNIPVEQLTEMPSEVTTQPAQTQIPAAEATATSAPVTTTPKLWVASYLPEAVTQGLVFSTSLEQTDNPAEANLKLQVGGDGSLITTMVYALVAPFPALENGTSLNALKEAWMGSPSDLFARGALYITPATLEIFSAWWGAPQGNFVQVVEEGALLSTAWAEAPAWSLIPFDQLTPEWKVLQVGGQSPLWKAFDPAAYGLSVPVRLAGDDASLASLVASELTTAIPAVLNRDAEKLTTVVLTGVTALVRATATEMERLGVLHPAEAVGDMMREADIAHISNEVPFAENCPPPVPVMDALVFCSDDKYIELLETIGTDVVELTGDHFSDWGVEATLHTFDMYDEKGWMYYGGGRTPMEGRLPITMEHNGNKIAFIGCNGKGGSYTPSTKGLPGAVDCDFDLITSEIARLKAEGYVVIMTFQHYEVYEFYPSPTMIHDFELVANAGADIVSGSQAHHPHGVSFLNDSLIMYGLGNFFFDQLLVSKYTAEAMVARHVVYNGQHISTEVIPIYFNDFSRPLYLEGAGANDLLKHIYAESTWGNLTYGINFNN